MPEFGITSARLVVSAAAYTSPRRLDFNRASHGRGMAKKTSSSSTDAERRVRQCERLARLLRVLQLISGKGRWDASALSAELGCSRRTVHRLLQTLSMANIPWYYDDHAKAYQVRAGFKFPLVQHAVSASERSSASPTDLRPLTDQLIEDGEAFAQSLQQFLNALKDSRNSRTASDRDTDS